MSIQPGPGYTFTSSSLGTNLNIQQPWSEWNGVDALVQQFECKVVSESDGEGGVNYFLQTYKGVVDYTWSQFPFRPEPDGTGGETAFRSFQNQARITDWAVYRNGTRTLGTDGTSEWMASNGKIEILNADYVGGSNQWLVCISKIDWWDKDSWLSAYRLIDAEKPFVSVFPADDTTATDTLLAPQGSSMHTGGVLYAESNAYAIAALALDPPVPIQIGYTVKKIASIDWNTTTLSWDVTQYEYGPITLPMHHDVGTMLFNTGTPPSPSTWDTAYAAEFGGVLNHPWFESTWAIPGYTLNPTAWWYDLVSQAP
jgi:hypothetical protein